MKNKRLEILSDEVRRGNPIGLNEALEVIQYQTEIRKYKKQTKWYQRLFNWIKRYANNRKL